MVRRAGAPTPDALRAASQQHMDARQQRLEAYADSLQSALDANPTGEQSGRLELRLAQARKEAHDAGRRRVPRGAAPSAIAPTAPAEPTAPVTSTTPAATPDA